MRFVTFFFLLFLTMACFADEVTIDSSTWTQEQKILTHAAVASLIDKAGYTLDYVQKPIQIEKDKIVVDETKIVSQTNPSVFKLSDNVDTQKLLNEINLIISTNAANTVLEEQKYQTIKTAIKTKLGMTDAQFANFIRVLRREVME